MACAFLAVSFVGASSCEAAVVVGARGVAVVPNRPVVAAPAPVVVAPAPVVVPRPVVAPARPMVVRPGHSGHSGHGGHHH